MDFRAPEEWAPMPDADKPPAERDASWWARCDFVDVKLTSPEAKLVGALLRRGVRRARLVKLERVQSRKLWVKYEQAQHWIALREGGDTNEQLLFHGTCALTPKEVCTSDEGLDPRFSSGGFYGRGTYLAESAAYPVGGRYAHRVSGHDGARMQLLIVQACAGASQECGVRVSEATKKMAMPHAREDGRRYDSVRAGPHRPGMSGPGDGGEGDDASMIWVLYKARAPRLLLPLLAHRRPLLPPPPLARACR